VPYAQLAEALLRASRIFGPALRSMQGPPERQKYFLPVVRLASPRGRGQNSGSRSWAGASAISWAWRLKS